MRIIAGRWRGRRLEAPAGLATRPTADRTRETLFSMLTSRLGSFEQLSIADLFAGSGALAFEALSRGAAAATLIETDAAARKVIGSNAASLGADIRLAGHSALTLPIATTPFDIVFADPPYAPGAGTAVRDAVEQAGWLAPGGWLAIETQRGERVEPGGFALDSERDVGRARLTLLRRPA